MTNGATSLSVAAKEWRQSWRDGRVRALLAALAALLVAALASGAAASARWQADADAAAAQDHRTWLAQDARNPHSVAHFGQFAFKPAGALAFFEPGVSRTSGSGVWMEAHYQNTATLRPADHGADRRGGLPAAWLLQLGLPLLIVLAGCGLWAAERESGTLRLQLVQGSRWHALLAGKALALSALALAVWLPLAIVLVLLAGDAHRALLTALAYLLYALTWVGLTLTVSALAAGAHTALAVLLALWVATTLVAPRVAADVAERTHPPPAATAFWEGIRKAQAEGVDGHDAADQRAKKLLQDTLDRFGAKSEAELPIAFAGIALQAGEAHGNAVFDRAFGALWRTQADQDRVRLRFAALSPLTALQFASQGAAGTDWQHHRHFVDAAEAHRRTLQVFLNDDFTRNAKGKDFDYRADPALWAKAPRWDYTQPSLRAAGSPIGIALTVLAVWLVVSAVAAAAAARRLVREGHP
jgi:ABC-2 type transport system permease protein